MDEYVVYHNPVCSKSRGALEILAERGADVEVIEYLKEQQSETRRQAFIGELKKKHKTTVTLRPPMVDVATAGRPEKGGGAKAPVTIIEFSNQVGKSDSCSTVR